MEIQVVVFDLGGVLVVLGGVREFGDMIGEADDSKVWERWLGCGWVRDYERGRCSTDEFALGMVKAHSLSHSPEDFLARFEAWPRGLYPGAAELVRRIRPEVRAACLSNTNELHWKRQRDALRLGELFPTRFLSHELDLIKPDREIYEHVVEDLGCRAGEVLFLDDNAINVDAAREVGIDAHCVRGLDQARSVLEDRNLLVPAKG